MMINQYYQCLELPPTASADEVRQAYKKLVKAWHPDRFEADSSMQAYAQERLKIINAAYDHLRRHIAANQRQPSGKATGMRARPSQRTAAPGRVIPGTILGLKRRLFSFLADMTAAWQAIFAAPDSLHAHRHGDRKTATQSRRHSKRTDSFLKVKATQSAPRTAGLKKMRNRVGSIYSLRRGYGPRGGRGLAPVAGIAAVEKSRVVSPISKIAPIRRVT